MKKEGKWLVCLTFMPKDRPKKEIKPCGKINGRDDEREWVENMWHAVYGLGMFLGI